MYGITADAQAKKQSNKKETNGEEDADFNLVNRLMIPDVFKGIR